MFIFVLVFFVCIALAMSVFTGGVALYRNQSYKKNHFLLMHSMVILFLFGYLLELTSTNVEEAYAAVRVMYAGAAFVAPFVFFFTADYCNTRVPPFIKIFMMVLSSAMTVTMWTTKFHYLVYRDYSFSFAGHLKFTPGPLYSWLHIYPLFCMILTMLVMFHQMRNWKNKYRKRLLTLLGCVAVPCIAEIIYFIIILAGMNKNRFYFTPHSLAVMSFGLYLGVVRVNIFEIISIGTVAAMKHIREGFILVDEDNNYLASNPAAIRILPGIAGLAKGASVFSADNWPKELRDMENDSVEFLIAEEVPRYFKASINPVFAKNKALMARMILLGEITDSVNLLKELENAAYIDALTGLYNRKHFSELANVDIERAQRLNQSIYTAMLDLDFFKQVNDTYGHAAGDLVLKAAAGIIRQTIRSYDLVGRYGGEEFVILIADLDSSEAYNLIERIRENMEHNTTFYEGMEIRVACSIGLAKFAEGDTMETAVRKADEALYASKHSGRNNVKVYGAL